MVRLLAMIKRETFKINKHEFGDMTGPGPWVIKKAIFHYHDEILDIDDSEDHYVIVKRQSDDKLFMFHWWYENSKFDYSESLSEVFAKKLGEEVVYE